MQRGKSEQIMLLFIPLPFTAHIVTSIVAQTIHFDLWRCHGQRIEHLDARQVLIGVQLLQLLLRGATIELHRNFVS